MKLLRPAIYALGLLAAALVETGLADTPPDLAHIRSAELYGFASALLLYLALLCSPLYEAFPGLPLRAAWTRARRALGVLAFGFAALHAWIGFFRLLSGWEGLPFLSERLQRDIVLSTFALAILCAMALTSFDAAQRALGRRWRWLHRAVYLAAVLVVVHLVVAGAHYLSPRSPVFVVSAVLVAVLLLLEAHRLDLQLARRAGSGGSFGIAFSVAAFAVASGVGLIWSEGELALPGHLAHRESVSRPAPERDARPLAASLALLVPPEPGKALRLSLSLQTARGERVKAFEPVAGKPARLIVVGEDLRHFAHVPAELRDGVFTGSVAMPRAGALHVYAAVRPRGADEQTFHFTVATGAEAKPPPPAAEGFTTRRSVDGFQVELSESWRALSFAVKDRGGRPVALRPYLGAPGHLVMIAVDDFGYIPMHPRAAGEGVARFEAREPTRRGLYKAFFEFDPGDGVIRVADFLVRF